MGYVCKKALEAGKDQVKKGEEVSQSLVDELTQPEHLADDELMVPVDMRGVGEDYEDVEQMVEKLGPKGTVEAFIKAADYFDANKDGEPEDERPKPMTAAEWRSLLEDDMLDEGMFEGEEEELVGDEEDADEDEEPATKKAKTD